VTVIFIPITAGTTSNQAGAVSGIKRSLSLAREKRELSAGQGRDSVLFSLLPTRVIPAEILAAAGAQNNFIIFESNGKPASYISLKVTIGVASHIN
jgi:hypothetical protein